MKKTLSVKKFVEGYNNRNSVELKGKYVEKVLEVNDYVTYIAKTYLAEKVIEGSCVDNGMIKIDSAKKHALCIYMLLEHWTNLEVSIKEIFNDYDLLEQNGLLDVVIESIPEKEVKAFYSLVDLKMSDFLTNNCGMTPINNELLTLKKTTSQFTDAVNDLLEKVNGDDVKNIVSFMSKQIQG